MIQVNTQTCRQMDRQAGRHTEQGADEGDDTNLHKTDGQTDKHGCCFFAGYHTWTLFLCWISPKQNQMCTPDCLVGLVVKASAYRAADLGFDSRLCQCFSGSNHTSDLKIGTPVATLPGACPYMVSAGTGRSGISILWLGEMESFICNFYLSMAAHTVV